jgi:hypothetical protein
MSGSPVGAAIDSSYTQTNAAKARRRRASGSIGGCDSSMILLL